MVKVPTHELAASLIADAHGRSQVPDFETRTPPEPSRLSRLRASGVGAPRRFMASVVAASRRVRTIAAGLLRSMNRHRWATGLVVLFVLLTAGSTGFVVYRHPFEPWPPEYSSETSIESGSCPYYDNTGGSCIDVFTDATSKKALTYITEDLAQGDPAENLYINFFHPDDDDGAFAIGCNYGEDSAYIAYRGEGTAC
jgi:hypothetical protein